MNKKEKYIFSLTKDTIHGNKSFFEHLYNTSKIVKNNFPDKQYLIDAALYHSVYGTCYFKPELNITRKIVEDLIGKRAEELVYIYCQLENRIEQILEHKFDDEIQQDLYILEYANLLEQFNSINEVTNLPFPIEEINKHKKIMSDNIDIFKQKLLNFYNLNLND